MPNTLTIDGVPLPGHLSRRALAAAVPIAALARSAPVAAGQADANASLVELGRQWKAIADQRDAYFEIEKGIPAGDQRLDELDALESQLYERQATIEEAIFAASATSVAALAVKARLLARLNDCNRLDAAAIESAMNAAPDFASRCAFSLALDVGRLADRETQS